MFAYPRTSSPKLVQRMLKTFPQPLNRFPKAHIPSIITQPQVEKILHLARNNHDRMAMMNEMTEWNEMTVQEQVAHSEGNNGCDFIEISSLNAGGIIIMSIYRMDEDRAYLRLDPDCEIVIQEITL